MSFVKQKLFREDTHKNIIPPLSYNLIPSSIQNIIKDLSEKIILHTGSIEHAVSIAKHIKEHNAGEMIYVRPFLPTLSDWIDQEKAYLRYNHIPDLKQNACDIFAQENLSDIVTVLGGNLRVTADYLARQEIQIDLILYDIDHHLIDPNIFIQNTSQNTTIIQQFKPQTSLKEIKRSRLFDIETYMNIHLIDHCLISSSHTKIDLNLKNKETPALSTGEEKSSKTLQSKLEERAKKRSELQNSLTEDMPPAQIAPSPPVEAIPELPSEEEQQALLKEKKKNIMRDKLRKRLAAKRKKELEEQEAQANIN